MKKVELQHFTSLIPIAAFLLYAVAYGMSPQAFHGAFELAGLLAVIVLGMEYKKGMVLDRLMVGLNCYLLIGAVGHLFSSERIIAWYARSYGGPLFFCIAMVGLFSTLFTKAGFMGTVIGNKQARKYGSFLLLAASFVAWIWSVNGMQFGIFWSVIAPYFGLLLIRDQLVKNIL